MRASIEGLYLSHTNYSDSTIILRLFTKLYGTQSFFVRGIKKKKGAAALIQPFHFVELTSNFNPDKDINSGNSVRLLHPTATITIDIRKTTVALFLTDVMNKALKSTEPNEELYSYLFNGIQLLDQTDFHPNYHIFFLSNLSKYLGFFPDLTLPQNQFYFNLNEGCFEYVNHPTSSHIPNETSTHLNRVFGTDFVRFRDFALNNKQRKDVLNTLVEYFNIQLDMPNNPINSHSILETVFED